MLWNTPSNRFAEHLGDVARKNIEANATKQIEKNRKAELNVGDHVRIKLSAIDSTIRKAIKQGDKKNIVVTYSTEVYRVSNRFQGEHSKPEYLLEDIEGTNLRHRFFSSDLLRVENPYFFPVVDVAKLNRM